MRAEKYEAKLQPNWCVTAFFRFELPTKSRKEQTPVAFGELQ
jgi:hypothetical protein